MAEEVEPAVRITLKDVWQEQRDMKEQLSRLVDQLPDHIKNTSDDLSAVNTRLDDHEARMRNLERRVWQAIGGGSLIITLATLVIGALALFVR